MRASPILVVLMLMIAPPSARGQQAQQDAAPPLERVCSVPADERWTPQEKFVWERICVGEVANFNEAPGYGGKLDPMNSADWPPSRILRPAFLEAILLNDPYRRALTRHGVVIVGARFVETIDLVGADLQHPLALDVSLVEKDANFSRLRSKHQIELAGSKVAGTVKLSALDLDADLVLNRGEFAALDLTGAHVSGQVTLGGLKVAGDSRLTGLRAGSLFMGGGEFSQVNLGYAHVGFLTLDAAKATGTLGMGSLRVDQTLSLDGGRFAEVDLTGVRVGEHLLMRNATFTADMKLSFAHVGGFISLISSEVAGDLSCLGLEVQQQVQMIGVKFGGSIDCHTAKIGSNLYLAGQFNKEIDLTGADIGGGLAVTGLRGVSLSLRNTKIGIIPDLAGAWPPVLEIDGLTYRSVVAANKFEEWFRRTDHYAPQPYEQLASVVQSQGNQTLATKIRYASRERERSEAKGGTWIWLTVLKWVIGYGHHPELSILWSLGFVVVGAIVLRISGEGPRNGMPYGLAYSFDILLPIIRLRDRHYAIDLKTWARYYFYVHRIMGYLLATFLAVGVAGLTK
ncbi:hypothetical protein [Bradyrhizobium sp.]|jgi:hypothetical protein|uniref:hypothetical protein n=1 Tax=Bradyrhizobium sp. TaxID=376 RepID=UPI002D80A669|nr:hypothetical protein [Bradyrhizobium sp.]